MPIQRTLLERIRDPGPPGQRHLHVSTREVFDSILVNLQNVLNTCQGNCLIDERYGLPHLSNVQGTMPSSTAGYEAAIRRTIERNEPRLTGVRVRHSPLSRDGFDLRFEISGMIVDEDGRTSVRFETYADDQGRLRVK
jgi:type VI secretion system lysozyme-like protein